MTRNYGQLYLFKVLLKKYESDDKNSIQKQELLLLANKCYKILSDLNDSEFKIENYPFIAKAYQYTGEFEKSIKILNERFDLYTIVIENKNIESYKQIRESHEIQLQQKELEKKEQLLQQKEALNNKLKQVNDELEQFTSMASHDLKSPLRTILTLCGFMKEGDLAAAEMNEYLSLIESDAVKMDNLINSLLRYSKIGYNNVEKEKIDLTDLINNVKVNLSTEIKNRNASINIENLPEIKGNKVLLEQLFQNLINNALKYNENQKPEITIRSEEIRNTIEIQDNGIGIPENKIQDVFKAFIRAHSASKYEGSGVGLATCKKIMDIHSGTISVSSEVGKGSCFSLCFND